MKKINKILKKINFIKIIIVELYLIVAQFVWHLKDYVIDYMTSKATTELQIKMIHIILNYGLATILTIILIALIISLYLKKILNTKKKA